MRLFFTTFQHYSFHCNHKQN